MQVKSFYNFQYSLKSRFFVYENAEREEMDQSGGRNCSQKKEKILGNQITKQEFSVDKLSEIESTLKRIKDKYGISVEFETRRDVNSTRYFAMKGKFLYLCRPDDQQNQAKILEIFSMLENMLALLPLDFWQQHKNLKIRIVKKIADEIDLKNDQSEAERNPFHPYYSDAIAIYDVDDQIIFISFNIVEDTKKRGFSFIHELGHYIYCLDNFEGRSKFWQSLQSFGFADTLSIPQMCKPFIYKTSYSQWHITLPDYFTGTIEGIAEFISILFSNGKKILKVMNGNGKVFDNVPNATLAEQARRIILAVEMITGYHWDKKSQKFTSKFSSQEYQDRFGFPLSFFAKYGSEDMNAEYWTAVLHGNLKI